MTDYEHRLRGQDESPEWQLVSDADRDAEGNIVIEIGSDPEVLGEVFVSTPEFWL